MEIKVVWISTSFKSFHKISQNLKLVNVNIKWAALFLTNQTYGSSGLDNQKISIKEDFQICEEQSSFPSKEFVPGKNLCLGIKNYTM